MSEPLHVQVAEVLGCKPQRYDPVGGAKGTGWACGCKGENWSRHGDRIRLHRYDTDWSATGPLVEKYKVNLEASMDQWRAFNYPGGLSEEWADGPTPLIAVCCLILALHKAGKLKEGA